MLALGDAQGGDIDARIAALAPDDIACIIYTSGTGGVPKGVLLSHRNILANCRGAYQLLEMLGLGDEVFLSFLPLSHSYEHTAGLMFPISIGAQIYFAEGADTLAANLLEVRPTIMTAVPRLYETMHQRIRRGIEREKGLKRRLFERAVAIGRKRLDGRALAFGERLIDPLLERLVRDKVRARFGGRLKAMVSGGAPLNPEIGSFFLALGVQLLQGYGQTEAAPVVCCNPPGAHRIDTVGPPLDGVEVRIAEDGEILVAGDNVMKGYWNDPEATARTLADGWLHTGDIGQLDARRLSAHHRPQARFHQEFRRRHDRAGEGRGRADPGAGDRPGDGVGRPPPLSRRGHRPRPGIRRRLCGGARRAGDLAALAARSRTSQGDRRRRRAGQPATLPAAERVRRFVIAGEPFSLANAQLTPTLKIRRHAIRAAYRRPSRRFTTARAWRRNPHPSKAERKPAGGKPCA